MRAAEVTKIEASKASLATATPTDPAAQRLVPSPADHVRNAVAAGEQRGGRAT